MLNLPLSELKDWPKCSEAVKQLMRKGAEICLSLGDEWISQLDSAGWDEKQHQQLLLDPVLVAATRRTNRVGIVHWASHNIQHPCEPVPPYLTHDMQMTALELHHRGLINNLINSERELQHIAFRLWMKIGFQLTQDHQLLEEFLDISQLSINRFIESNIKGMREWLAQQVPLYQDNDPVPKRQYVSAILEGEPLEANSEQRLGYQFSHPHLACVIWTTSSDAQLSQLETVKDFLLSQVEPTSHMTVIAGSATLWLWCDPTKSFDQYQMIQQLKKYPHILIALGSLSDGLDGFRHSHFEALTVQRLMARLTAPQPIVSIEQARLISLVTQDLKTAQHYMHQVLGKFIYAETALHHSARVYLKHGCNASVASQHLFVHRNTLLRRLEQINQLLPQPIENNLLDVGIALEMLAWLSPDTLDYEG